MKKLISFILAAVMAFSPLAVITPDSVTAYAYEAPAALTYGTDLPAFTTTASRVNSTPYDTGHGHSEILFDATGVGTIGTEIDAYKTALAGDGFTLRGSENTAGGNRMFTYYKSNGAGGYTVVHCNYFTALNEFRIVYGTETFVGAASAGDVAAPGSIEPTISVIGMSEDALCNVIQLSDGSFIVIDGGWGTDATKTMSYTDLNGNSASRTINRDGSDDIEGLLDFLSRKKPSGVSKPQVTWMYTHCDPDHIMLSAHLMESFASSIDVNMVVYNFPTIDATNEIGFTNGKTGAEIDAQITAFAGYQQTLLDDIETYYPGADHFIYHTGQKLYFPGCEVEFVFTQEDYRPNTMAYMNDASGAWRFTFTDSSKTALFLGDCSTALNTQINNVFGSYLDSDILQVAHHGSNGGYKPLYQNVDPTVCFWACSDFAFNYYLKQQGGTAENHMVEGTDYEFNYWLRNESNASLHLTNSATHTLIVSTLTEDLDGGALIHQELYTGYKGSVVAYLSDLLGDAELNPFEAGSGVFRPDRAQNDSIFLINSTGSVNNNTTSNSPRSLTTKAESTRTFGYNEIVLGWTGKLFTKGLGAHITANKVDTSRIVYKVGELGAQRFYGVAGMTGQCVNLTNASTKFGVTFNVYGSMADSYSDTMSYTLLSSVDGIEGNNKSANTHYNTAEFDVDISGYNFIKLEAVSDAGNTSGQYAWGEACLYNPMEAKAVVTRPENLAGKSIYARDITYLSDLYSTAAKVDSYVIGAGTVITSSRDFTVDESFSDIYIWNGNNQRYGITSDKYSGGRAVTITNADSTTSSVTYYPRELAIGYRATKFEKGLGAVASPATMKSATVTFDISGLGAERFYTVAGITGAGNQSTAALNAQETTFSIYGSKTSAAPSSFELLSYTENIHAYLMAEFDLDIKDYKYLKLEATNIDAAPTNKQFIWADTCVYKDIKIATNITSSGNPEGRSESTNVIYLSDLYGTAKKVSSFVIGSGNSEASPRDYKCDTNWDTTKVGVWTGNTLNAGSTVRQDVTANNTELYVTNYYGDVETVSYNRSDIVLGYHGTKYAKGLSALISPNSKTPTSVVFDLQGLNAEYFYSVVGLTANGNKNDASTYSYKVRFNVYGSKTGTEAEDFVLMSYASDIRAYLTAEFKVPVSGYKYLKLEAVSSNNTNSGGSISWADACVYDTNPVNKMKQVAVTAGSDLTMNVVATTEAGVTAPSARFTGTRDTVTVDGVYLAGKWVFTFDGISAQYMSAPLTIELLDDEGEVLETKSYSVREYCDDIHQLGQTNKGKAALGLTAAKFTQLDTLMADMLEYGAAAQNYVGYTTNNLANSLSWVAGSKTAGFAAPSTDFSTSAYSSGNMIRGAGLRLGNDVRFLVRVNATNATKLVVSNGVTEKVYLLSEADYDGSTYRVVTDGLYATDFDSVYTFTLADASTTYHTITYSVNSYVASKAGGSNATLATIVRALYNYGASADAYAA